MTTRTRVKRKIATTCGNRAVPRLRSFKEAILGAPSEAVNRSIVAASLNNTFQMQIGQCRAHSLVGIMRKEDGSDNESSSLRDIVVNDGTDEVNSGQYKNEWANARKRKKKKNTSLCRSRSYEQNFSSLCFFLYPMLMLNTVCHWNSKRHRSLSLHLLNFCPNKYYHIKGRV